MTRDPFDELEHLAGSGALRLAYVIGVARSNSTLVARLLGRGCDAIVYEPALPASPRGRAHYAQTLLQAYGRARGAAGDRPVTLVVKDLSLFLDAGMIDFIDRHAQQVVFTIREPEDQHASLVRQFAQEFSIPQRIDAVIRHPLEVAVFLFQLLRLGPMYGGIARAVLPPGTMGPAGRAMAGWNILSWRRLAAQVERLSAQPGRCTIFDAAQMRVAPEIATASLNQIASRFSPAQPGQPIEIAAHSRMRPRSAWAKEALGSDRIKPATNGPAPRPLPEALLNEIEPIYRRLLDSPLNPLGAIREPGFSSAK